MTQPLNTHVLEIEDFPESTPESIKILKAHNDHLYRLMALLRWDLGATTVIRVQDDNILVCVGGIYYFLKQESNQYILTKINYTKDVTVHFYNAHGVMLPPERTAQDIADILGIDATIPIPKPVQLP